MTLLRPLRRPRLAVAGWCLLLALVAAGSLMPAGDLPPPPVHGFDKVEHLAGYALLSGYAVLLFATTGARWSAAIFVVMFGLGIEAAQSAFTASREADALDVLANTLGAGLGQLVAYSRFARLLERSPGDDIDEHRLRDHASR